jgi:hypothetical protein
MNSPIGENRGGTPEGERALQRARRAARCGGFGTASFGVPLPFFSVAFVRAFFPGFNSWLHCLASMLSFNSWLAERALDAAGPTAGVI